MIKSVNKKYLFLILSLLGILILITFMNYLPPEKITISQIKQEDINKKIELSASITIIYEKPDFQILLLIDKTGNITAISNSDKHLSFNKSKIYIIEAKIQEYNSSLQLNIDKITESEN